jgi:hypothetical protein
MNGLLAIAEGFVEKMTNPQHGSEVNDEYSLRFNHMLASDPAFANAFASLALSPEDVDSLPSCAWPWYLQWRTQHAPPPARDFLDALFDSTDDPAVRMSVMISTLSGSDRDDPDPPDAEPSAPGGPDPGPPGYDPEAAQLSHRDDLEEAGDAPAAAEVALRDSSDRTTPTQRPRLESGWLGSRVAQLTSGPARTRALGETTEFAMYLLQLGDPEAVRELLELQWPGQADLREAVRALLDDAGLDRRTLDDWHSRLRLA